MNLFEMLLLSFVFGYLQVFVDDVNSQFQLLLTFGNSNDCIATLNWFICSIQMQMQKLLKHHIRNFGFQVRARIVRISLSAKVEQTSNEQYGSQSLAAIVNYSFCCNSVLTLTEAKSILQIQRSGWFRITLILNDHRLTSSLNLGIIHGFRTRGRDVR